MIELLHTLGASLAIAGALLAIVGAIGVIRFPDFYTRIHAASITDTGGATMMIVGLAMISGLSMVTFKLVVIWVFIMFTSPTAAHALANAAFGSGERPLLGSWRLINSRSSDRAGR
ncbi:MAG: monovalent cation/H(+) antiporter subunit G [Alphaproteobacteria bacterium]